MAKLSRDTTGYTAFGMLLDELCKRKRMSFRALATESGLQPGYHTVIAKACRGKITPKREHLLAWATILDATTDQRRNLLHAFHYAEDESLSELEATRARIGKQEQEILTLHQQLEAARARIAKLEHP